MQKKATLKILITYVDFYDSVIRIFGRTPENQSVLCHVHEFYAYFYFKLPLKHLPNERTKTIIRNDINSIYPNSVKTISFRKSKSFYGYQENDSMFVRVELVSPSLLLKVRDLLVKGYVLKSVLQPYETHISYIMHFLADFNLSGMKYIIVKNSKARYVLATPENFVTDMSISFSVESPTKTTQKEIIEVDCTIHDIVINSFDPSIEIPSLDDWIKEAKFFLQENDFPNEIKPSFQSKSVNEPDQAGKMKQNLLEWFNYVNCSELPGQDLSVFSVAEDTILSAGEVENEIKGSQELVGVVEDWDNLGRSILFTPETNIFQEDSASESESEGEELPVWSQMVKGHAKYVEKRRNQASVIETSYPNFLIKQQKPPIILQNATFRSQAERPSTQARNMKYHEDVAIDKIKKYLLRSSNTSLPLKGAVIEIFTNSNNGRQSHPERDAVCVIVLAVLDAIGSNFCEDFVKWHILDVKDVQSNEVNLFKSFLQVVTSEDPDFLIGYEVQKDSLGYLLKRAEVLKIPHFVRFLSRVPYGAQDARHMNDTWGDRTHSGYWIPGRIILNLWRILRHQVNLHNYSVQKASAEVLKEPFPKYSKSTLQNLYLKLQQRDSLIDFLKRKCLVSLKLIDKLNIILKTAQMAQFICTDFFSVLTRGSQYRVEGVLLRIAKRKNFLLPSATKDQVKSQNALEEISLTLEPQAKYYKKPVAVLDFRSLYPSIIISHNLCYTTIYGKFNTSDSGKYPFNRRLGPFKNLVNRSIDNCRELLEKDHLYFAPNRVLYVKATKQKGILPIMLKEILDTRILIKKAMKAIKPALRVSDNEINSTAAYLLRLFDARQLSLKLTANVTYGYASASYSGRMPCAEIADSIVKIGRTSLEKCVSYIDLLPLTSVVYGDTDSVFVKYDLDDVALVFKEAISLAQHISTWFPFPMELQFEKVYSKCFLISKKRYCGAIFESIYEYEKYNLLNKSKQSIKKLRLDSKGIEIIRRDTCPLVGVVMEKLIKMLYLNSAVEQVEELFYELMENILLDKYSVKDFIISSKVRLHFDWKTRKLISGYRSDVPPPSAIVALKKIKKDPMDYPMYKERVGYIIVSNPKSVRLVDKVVSPTHTSKLNYEYYINHKILPAIDRVFSLAGVSVYEWWTNCCLELSERSAGLETKVPMSVTNLHLETYVKVETCDHCKDPSKTKFCSDCYKFGEVPMSLAIKNKKVNTSASKAWILCNKCDTRKGGFCLNYYCQLYYQRNFFRHQQCPK